MVTNPRLLFIRKFITSFAWYLVVRAKRVMVFIDGSNIYHALIDNLGTTKIHYGKLAEVLASDGELVMAYYYDTSNRPNDYTMTAKRSGFWII